MARPATAVDSPSGINPNSNTANEEKTARAKTERRREQCRRNQQRYRDRQRGHAAALDDSVIQLRREVDQLQTLRDRMFCNDAAVQTVIEYYRLLGHGFHTDRTAEPLAVQQAAFLAAVVDDDISMAGRRGRGAYFEQLRLWTTVCDELVVYLHRLEVVRGPDGTAAIHQSTHSEITITPRTIRLVFPHLLQTRHEHIQRKLLGARLTCPGWGLQICDARGKFVHVAWSIDLVAALLGVLTLDETAIALGHAQIKCDAYLELP